MSSKLHRRPGGRSVAAVAAVAALGLGAAACSSNGSSSAGGGGGKVTISIDCAPAAAQFPVQHRQWLQDVTTFEKANPKITVQSVFNYPCEVPATFTAMHRAERLLHLFH